MEAMLVIFTALLADNLLFTRLFGAESFFAPSKRAADAAAYGIIVTLVTVLSGAVSLALYKFVFSPLKLGYIITFISVPVISATVCGAHFAACKLGGKHRRFAADIPLITTNCVVIGSIMLCVENSYSYGASLLYLLFAGLGFTLAMLVFSAVRERLELADPPECFEGLPILLLSASFAAMAFSGFYGLSF